MPSIGKERKVVFMVQAEVTPVNCLVLKKVDTIITITFFLFLLLFFFFTIHINSVDNSITY